MRRSTATRAIRQISHARSGAWLTQRACGRNCGRPVTRARANSRGPVPPGNSKRSCRMPLRSCAMPERALVVLHVAEVIKGGICSYLRELIQTQCQLYGPQRIRAVVPARQAHELQPPEGVMILGFEDEGHRAINA